MSAGLTLYSCTSSYRSPGQAKKGVSMSHLYHTAFKKESLRGERKQRL